jgi:hypothetical protein
MQLQRRGSLLSGEREEHAWGGGEGEPRGGVRGARPRGAKEIEPHPTLRGMKKKINKARSTPVCRLLAGRGKRWMRFECRHVEDVRVLPLQDALPARLTPLR